jgi:putative transcriptional regulator
MTETFEGSAMILRPVRRLTVFLLACLALAAAPSAGQPGMRRSESPSASPFPSAFSTKPSRGKFLVAARQMGDPRFAQTVVLLVAHDQHGTMGLVINRRTSVPLSSVLSGIGKGGDPSQLLYVGGPVQMDVISLLVRSERERSGAIRLLDGVYFSTSAALLKQMIAKKQTAKRLRVFAGYAGWAVGQLDQELERGDWYVLDARAEEVFHEPPSEIWSELIRRAEARWVWLPGTPSMLHSAGRGASGLREEGFLWSSWNRTQLKPSGLF